MQNSDSPAPDKALSQAEFAVRVESVDAMALTQDFELAYSPERITAEIRSIKRRLDQLERKDG